MEFPKTLRCGAPDRKHWHGQRWQHARPHQMRLEPWRTACWWTTSSATRMTTRTLERGWGHCWASPSTHA
eukprot:8520142-Alexandrium_andersonii.AAC.1